MSILTQNWIQRTSWLLLISLGVAGFLALLTFTNWAESMRIVEVALLSQPSESEREMAAGIRFIAPFIKEIILIGIPLAISLLIGRSFTLVTKAIK